MRHKKQSNTVKSGAGKGSSVVTRSKASEGSCQNSNEDSPTASVESVLNPNEMDKEALSRIERRLDKLEDIDKLAESIKHLTKAIQKIDTKLEMHEERLRSVEDAVEQSVLTLTETQEKLDAKASSEYVTKLEEKIDDLENRSRRNNIIFNNVPEKSEDKPHDCAEFVETFIDTFIGMKDVHGNPILVERAHRGRTSRKDAPRPIHARIMNWQNTQALLHQAPKLLRNKLYKDQRIYITDDVSYKQREKRKSLIPQRNELRKQGLFAYIPFKVPAVLVYRDEAGNLKTIVPPHST